MQREVENALSKRLLSGEFGNGDTILISVEDDHLAFTKIEKAEFPADLRLETSAES